ncbi:hypothetical protein [Paenibacillus cellulosilyticus]
MTYYTWLEQGKEVNPSPEVLLSISKAHSLTMMSRSICSIWPM